MKPGTFAISWGRWGGLSGTHGTLVKRICVGPVAITWLGIEIDDLLEEAASTPSA